MLADNGWTMFRQYHVPIGLAYLKPKVRDRPIFRTDLQIRTIFGFGWLGVFTEKGVRILREKKSVHQEMFQYFITLFFHFKFFPSSYQCDIPIGELSIRNKFYG